jgi:undecaprenyl-diphosphatase
MLSYYQAIILGLLQGFSELFPISSLGHSVILPHLVGWNIKQNDPFFLTFLVATHFATAVVLVGFYWNDWKKIISGMGQSLKDRGISPKNTHGKIGWLLVVGTIPVGVLALLLEDQIRQIFASATSAAFFLIINGMLLYGAERLRQRNYSKKQDKDPDVVISKLTWKNALSVGGAQAIALIPGLSRSGASMGGGLLIGLNNEEAARFGFLLATPVIGAAALVKVTEFFNPANYWLIGPAIAGALCSGITAYLALRYLVRYFESNRLTPFALYCVLAGTVYLIVLFVR